MRWVPQWPLPERAFIPGRTPRPTEPAPAGTALDRPADEWRWDEDYLYGVDLYAAGFFWEAHEAWEGAWRAATDPARRHLLQGLIQCAAAVLKAAVGATDGARSLVSRGTGHLERAARRAPPPLMGLDVGRTIDAFRDWAASPAPAPASRPALALRVRSRDRLASLTDLRTVPAGTDVERGDGCLVVRTPERPDDRDGGYLLLDRAPAAGEIEAWLGACRRHLGARPGRRPTLCWEVGPGVESFGGSSEALVVLRGEKPPAERRAPAGTELRPIRAADWDALFELSAAVCAGGGRDLADVMRSRIEALRRGSSGSAGDVWGAFRGPRMIGCLGLFESPTLLRFQEVMTRPDERGRGVATALIARALGAASGRSPRALAVAVAGGRAERIYRRLGFARAGTQYWLRGATTATRSLSR